MVRSAFSYIRREPAVTYTTPLRRISHRRVSLPDSLPTVVTILVTDTHTLSRWPTPSLDLQRGSLQLARRSTSPRRRSGFRKLWSSPGHSGRRISPWRRTFHLRLGANSIKYVDVSHDVDCVAN